MYTICVKTMNINETIDELFAQVLLQLQKSNATKEVAIMMQTLKKQVLCTIAIGNQQPLHHIMQSLQQMQLQLEPL